MNKRERQAKRARRTREKIKRLGAVRLCVYRSANHIYAQLISSDANVLSSGSTLEKEVKERLENRGGNTAAAAVIGVLIAERAKRLGIVRVAFDRSGYKYHGRVRALAEAARSSGMEF